MRQSIQSTVAVMMVLGSVALATVGLSVAATPPPLMATPAIPMPALTGGSVMLDLPSGSAENITLDIQQGRFANQSVGNLKLNAQGIDFRQGSLKSLGAEVRDGQFENIPVDLLKLNANAFSFDTMELLNHRRFMLAKPVDAAVVVKISEANLNKYLANPKTLDRLEKAIARKTGNVALIKLTNPAIVLGGKAMGKGGGNKVKLTLNATISDLASTPLELLGTLGSNQGKLQFMDMVLSSNGMPLPVDVASILQTKLNEMIDLERLGKNNFTIRAQTVTVANHQLEVTGQASLTRLEFGQ
jgi:hypothetical protein